MILKAKHNWLIYNFLERYSVCKTNRHFREVKIIGDYNDKGFPLLLLSNHISWWDGFWAVYVNVKIFHRRFHFMMLEKQLKKFIFFNLAGGYSVSKGSRSVIESINYTIELLSDSRNMVLLFPQGKIASVYEQSLHFEKGTERIVRGIKGKVQILFMANLVDYFSEEKPTLFIYLKEYALQDHNIERIQDDFNNFYTGCVASNISKADN